MPAIRRATRQLPLATGSTHSNGFSVWADKLLVSTKTIWATSRKLFLHAVSTYSYFHDLDKTQVIQLQKLWTELEEHSNVVIAVNGRLGGLVNILRYEKMTNEESVCVVCATFAFSCRSVWKRRTRHRTDFAFFCTALPFLGLTGRQMEPRICKN